MEERRVHKLVAQRIQTRLSSSSRLMRAWFEHVPLFLTVEQPCLEESFLAEAFRRIDPQTAGKSRWVKPDAVAASTNWDTAR